MTLSNSVEALLDLLRDLRRELHQIPELGLEEFKTAATIQRYLKEWEIPYESGILGTGIIVSFKGTPGEKTLCFRADMDALPVDEKTGVDFQSKHENRMHACGHDGHMATLLGLAKYLKDHEAQLRHNVVLLFQPAEEGPGGAQPILEGGYLKQYQVDEIYGLHLFPNLPEETYGVCPGPMMSSAGEFDIIVKGKSGHGATPHVAIDSVIVASALVSGLQTLVSRSINPLDPAVVTIGRIYGGERRNVIAKEVVLEGTIRTFNEATYGVIKERMRAYAQGLAVAHQCEIEVVIRDMYPPVINDHRLTQEFIDAMPQGAVTIIEPLMLAEDFAYYQREIPGVFFFVGCRNEEKNFCYSLHHEQFNFDERILGYGLQAFINILTKRGGFIVP